GGSGVIDVPSIRISPDVGRSNPAIIRSVVVFPDPDAPRKVRNSPAAMSSERSSTAVKVSKRLVRCWSWRIDWDIGDGERGTAKGERRVTSALSPFPFPVSPLLGRLHLVPHLLILVAPRAPLPEVHLGAVLGDVSLGPDLLG